MNEPDKEGKAKVIEVGTALVVVQSSFKATLSLVPS